MLYSRGIFRCSTRVIAGIKTGAGLSISGLLWNKVTDYVDKPTENNVLTQQNISAYRKYTNILHCQGFPNDEAHSITDVAIFSDASGKDCVYTDKLACIPEILKPFFMAACWGLLISVWLCALAGPVLVVYAITNQAWDLFLNAVCFWLLAGLIQFPYIPAFSELVSSGLVLWFDVFSIHYNTSPKSSCVFPTPSGPTIYCYHPHGLLSIGMALLAVDLVRRGESVAIVTSSHMRWFNPILKILLDIAGIQIVGSSPKEVQAAMKEGKKSLILVPGGYEEGVLTREGFERVYLKNRIGFVKYAMRHGYSLTPVYAYGENDLFTCIPFADSVRKYLASWKLPIVFFYGHPQIPFMPKHQQGIRVVVGQSLAVPRIADPHIDTLHTAHAAYVDTLLELYYRNNKNSDRPLEIY